MNTENTKPKRILVKPCECGKFEAFEIHICEVLRAKNKERAE